MFVVFFFNFIYLFLERGEGGRKRGRETSMCGCLLSTPNWGPGLQPRHVPWLGIEPVTLWFTGWHSVYWATPARATLLILITSFLLLVFNLVCSSLYSSTRHKVKITDFRLFFFFFFPKNFIYLFFRERGREAERGKETSKCERYINRLPLTPHQLRTWPATQALTGNWTFHLSVRRPALNPLSHDSQGSFFFFKVGIYSYIFLPWTLLLAASHKFETYVLTCSFHFLYFFKNLIFIVFFFPLSFSLSSFIPLWSDKIHCMI